MDDYRIKRYRRYDAEVNERDQKADNGLVLPSANLLFQKQQLKPQASLSGLPSQYGQTTTYQSPLNCLWEFLGKVRSWRQGPLNPYQRIRDVHYGVSVMDSTKRFFSTRK